jgi:hypothetical protein
VKEHHEGGDNFREKVLNSERSYIGLIEFLFYGIVIGK